MVRQVKRDEDEDEGLSTYWKVAFTIGGAVALIYVLAAVYKPSTQSYVDGLKVVSVYPLEKLKDRTSIALYNTSATPAELTCKLELSAISIPDRLGYRIKIETGDTGIYLNLKDAAIRGRTQEDMLRACHVFACVRDGISCWDFAEIEDYISNASVMSVILDKDIDQPGGRGYAEIIGALSYYQTKKVDANGDGDVTQDEVNANEFFIYPFLKDGDTCIPQPLNNQIQNWSRSNQTVECSKIAPAIMVLNSNETSIRIEDGRIVVSGSGDSVHTASIIMRDVISPEWVRAFHGYT